MAVRTVTQFKALYGTAGSLFPDNTTGEISEADVRAFGEDIADSFFNESDDSYISAFPQVTATGTNTYAATLAPAITAYATGQKFQIKFTNASSGVSTLNLNAVGAKKIFVNPTTQATTGHIVAGQISLLAYDAALDAAAGGFLMLGAPSTSASTLGAVLTAGNDASGLQIKNLFNASDPQDAVTLDQMTTAADAKVADAINDGTTTIAPSQNAVFDALALKSPLASPTFTGVPAGPTAAQGTNTTQVATTAFVFTEAALKQSIANTASALTDGGSIAITGAKHTLTTTQSTITFSQSFTGDFTNIDVTFTQTAATWTFPTGSLCVVEGSASGNNTATIAAVSGDKIVISIWFVSSGNYRVACKNFGQ